MNVLTHIPFLLNADQIMASAHVAAGSDDAADLLALIALAQKDGRPKAAYAPAFITGRDAAKIQIGEVTFTSRMLVHNLKSVERVFPLIATCGHELDDAFQANGDVLQEFWWDLIKTRLLAEANRFLNEHIRQLYRLSKTATMRPGSGDAEVWPLEQQKGLFRLLDGVEEKLGVRLTESFLMIPNKTTSGILFPTETDFRNCEVCRREDCPSRHALFNSILWKDIQHD